MGTSSDRLKMKRLLVLLACVPFLVVAQQPYINAISPTHATVGETVTISGANLNNVDRVYFGGISVTGGEINIVSNNIIQVTVPAGATHAPIIVKTSGNEMAASSQPFFISFSGAKSTINEFSTPSLVPSTHPNVYDICMCDLDNDDFNDIAIAHNVDRNTSTPTIEVTVYENNNPSPGSFSLLRSIDATNNLSGAIAVTCGDLDLNGSPELIISSNRSDNISDIFIYRNAGSVQAHTIKLPAASTSNRSPRKIVVGDVDQDGNPDLVVGNAADRAFLVYRGNGTVNGFNNTRRTIVPIETQFNTSSLTLADLNNDGRPEVISLPFREPSQGITIMRNNSQPGAISFVQQTGITATGQRINVTTADFDQDGFVDIATTSQSAGEVTVYRNTTSSTGGNPSFGSQQEFPISGAGPWGLDIGDMDGDGLPDLIIGSNGGDQEIHVLENTSTGTSINFGSPVSISTNPRPNQNLAIGDLNGDARPDIAYTDDVRVGVNGSLGVIINQNCVIPELSPDPAEGGAFCSGDLFTITTIEAPGATYSWSISGNTSPSTFPFGSTNTQDFQLAGSTNATISVTITTPDGCSESVSRTYDVSPGANTTPNPTIQVSSPGVLCVGDNATISSNATGANHFWTLPDGSTRNTPTISLNPISATDAGEYTLIVRDGANCSSSEVTRTIQVAQPPLFEILSNSDVTNFCTGTNVTLSVPAGFSYQWSQNGADIGGATGRNYTTNQSGEYKVAVLASGCETETAGITITSIPRPNSSIDGPAETCAGIPTTFMATSTGQPGFSLEYEWAIQGGPSGINETVTGPNLDFTFPAPGSYNVTLQTNYPASEVFAGVGSCNDNATVSVTVFDDPTITFDLPLPDPDSTDPCISDPKCIFKCQGEPFNVSITSPEAETISSYTWSTRNANETNNADTLLVSGISGETFDATTPFGVDSLWAILEITTDIGCTLKDSIKVVNLETDVDISASGFDADADSITLGEANFVSLTAEKISGVRWRPNDIVSDSTNVTVNVFPKQRNTTITVIGTDEDGCLVSSEIQIILDNLRPKRTFSPNGDGINDCWEILNSSGNLGIGCKAYVFDARGRNVFVGDAPFENNCVWDGNFNSSPVTEGVYYYVLKCSDSQLNKSGSILLAR